MSGNFIEGTFNVQRDCPRFVSWTNELRYRLRDLSREQLYDNLYMLRPYTAVPQQWLRLRMQDGSTEIIVWVRTDNLYVVGFDGRGRWEFGRRSDEDWQQLLDGSEPLGFDGGYTGRNLGDLTMGPPPGQQMRADLGQQQLVDGIRGLAAYQGGGDMQLRSWLRTIVITICESIRSQKVCIHVGNLLGPSSSGWLTNELINIIHNWQKISLCLIQSANDPDIPGLYRCLRERGVCANTHQAREQVAIVYHGPTTSSSSRSSRQRRSATANDGTKVDDVATGLTFVEVLDVVVEDDDPCELYGTATVDDGLIPVDAFSREWENTQHVGPRGSLELTGPSRAIWGYDEVVFDLDLMSRDTVPDMSPGDQISNGQLVWNAHQKPLKEYNRPKECTVDGIKIRYAVLTDAVVATVEVRLTPGEDENDPDLYGSIVASTSALYQQNMALFKREHKDCVSLYAGDTVPLLRSVFVVPLGSSLNVDADLWDRSFVTDMSPDDHIADDRASFDAKLRGKQNQEIFGPHGHVTVYVTWSRT